MGVRFDRNTQRGFNLEDTHLTRLDRLSKLMAVLAVAFCWAHKVGEWQNEIKPIKIKKHGCKAESFFHKGLNKLRRMLAVLPASKTEVGNIIKLLFIPPPGPQVAKIGVIL